MMDHHESSYQSGWQKYSVQYEAFFSESEWVPLQLLNAIILLSNLVVQGVSYQRQILRMASLW